MGVRKFAGLNIQESVIGTIAFMEVPLLWNMLIPLLESIVSMEVFGYFRSFHIPLFFTSKAYCWSDWCDR